jgi:hypothetical protein
VPSDGRRGIRLTPLEIASGIVLGVEPEDDLSTADSELVETPLEALERVIRPALKRPPCLVSFSGGRDSSAILAAATNLARREGLPPPVPATNVVRTEAADERDWQELIVRHLRLKDWLRIEIGDELDAVGPIAAAVLRRHGVLWPFNAHFHKPLLAEAAGGSMLTGIGGDELFGTSPTGVSLLLAGRVRPNRRDVARLGLAFGPRRLRSAVLARRIPMRFPWLLEGAQRRLAAAWGRQAAAEPRRWRDQVHWWRRLRYFRIGLASLDLLAADEDVTLVHPFAAAPVATALLQVGGKVGPGDRAASMKLLFGGLLPGIVLERPTKAQFDAVFWNRPSRTFVTAWDGEGIDPELVDLEALRALWSSPNPPAQTFTQLQAAWLACWHARAASTPDRGEQRVGRRS